MPRPRSRAGFTLTQAQVAMIDRAAGLLATADQRHGFNLRVAAKLQMRRRISFSDLLLSAIIEGARREVTSLPSAEPPLPSAEPPPAVEGP